MDPQYRPLNHNSSFNLDHLPDSSLEDFSSHSPDSSCESADPDAAEYGLDPEREDSATEEEASDDIQASQSLPLLLQMLFSFNGITLALPSTALMYIVNDRVAMPIHLLPTYAAIAFLPCSLRPLYALCNGYFDTVTKLPRHYLLSTLLLANAISIWTTAWIPPQGIIACFAWAFVRSATSSWAEFLLGLVLLDHVQQHSTAASWSQSTNNNNDSPNRNTTTATSKASQYQAQAATARNLGSFVSYAMATLYFGVSQAPLNQPSASTLLHLAAVVHLVGAMLALLGRVGTTNTRLDLPNKDFLSCRTRNSPPCASGSGSLGNHSYHSVGVVDTDDVHALEEHHHLRAVPAASTASFETDRKGSAHDPDLTPTTTSSTASLNQICSANTLGLIVSFQLALILLTTREAIVGATSNGIWLCLMVLTLVALVASGCQSYVQSLRWDIVHRIGLFLILRHALPSSTYLMDSYLYTILQSHPIILQLLSVHTMGISTVAAWSYGRYLSRPFGPLVHQYFYRLIVVTTVVASFASLCQIFYVITIPHLALLPQVTTILAVQSLLTLTGEWRFLPDVVLATVGAVDPTFVTTPTRDREDDTEATTSVRTAMEEEESNPDNSCPAERSKVGFEGELQYGTLISCIDFGEQVGALLAGPLVSVFQVNRENDWAHLDALVACTAILSLLTLGFLGLLPNFSTDATSLS